MSARRLIHFGNDETKIPQSKTFLETVDTDVVKSVLTDFTDGDKEVSSIFGARASFPNPKPTTVTTKLIQITADDGETIIDYFAGSGSTGHAVISLNRDLNRTMRYILIEQGPYFDTVIKPRMQKVVYSADWKDGKPTAPSTGISHAFKVLKLESYEDTLNNLNLARAPAQADLLAALPPKEHDAYLMAYMLDVESRGSLLSVDDFKKPFDYRLKIAVDSAGAWAEQKIDLVETFNYLIGLSVRYYESDIKHGYVRVTGSLPDGRKAQIIWRDCDIIDYDRLTKLIPRWDLNLAEKTSDFDVTYINGDHTIPIIYNSDEAEGGAVRTLKLQQIEPEFLRAMFDVADV